MSSAVSVRGMRHPSCALLRRAKRRLFDWLRLPPDPSRTMTCAARNHGLVIVGTRVWNASVSAPFRTYLTVREAGHMRSPFEGVATTVFRPRCLASYSAASAACIRVATLIGS
jgi:hypothetical protein